LPLLALPQAAESARGTGSLQARITIVSACSTQQALFGSQAQGSSQVTVICQPGMTPFLTQSVSLNNTESGAGSNASTSQSGGAAGGAGNAEGPGAAHGPGVPFDLVSKNEVLSPPLPSASTFASKVIYVMF
jgi:hypothetical protein